MRMIDATKALFFWTIVRKFSVDYANNIDYIDYIVYNQ